MQLAVKTVVPHDAMLDGTSPPPQPAEPALLHTPSGPVKTSDLASTVTEQITGASKARSKPTATGATPASAPKTKASHDRRKGRAEGAKEFTQRKLHEMKGVTPLSKKKIEYSSSRGMEGTGEADVLPSSSLAPPVPPPYCASQEKSQKQFDLLPSTGAFPPSSLQKWKHFVPSSTPRPPAAALPPAPGPAAAATLQSPPSVVSKTWKGLSPTPALNLNMCRVAVSVPPQHIPLAPRGLALPPPVSRPLQAPPDAAAMVAGAKTVTSPLPSFGQFAFNAKSAKPKPSLVQKSKEVFTEEDFKHVTKQRAASGGPSAVPAAGVKDNASAAQPKKKQRIKLSNTPSSLNWLSTKFKTASACTEEHPENQTNNN
jgi:hypothetical protein